MDSKFNGPYRIQCTWKEMSKGIGILYRAKDYLNYATLLTLH